MIIGSLDIGIVNVGFCVYDTSTCRVRHVEIINLIALHGQRRLQFQDKSAVFLVKRAINARKALFDECDVIGIEKQMTRKMVIIQYVFESVLSESCTVFQVPPRSVKTFFHTSRGNHLLNKKAAIVCLLSLLDDDGKAKIARFHKKDDVADAILQAMYISHHYELLMDKKIEACSGRKKKKRRRR
jgi:hypothetical protein